MSPLIDVTNTPQDLKVTSSPKRVTKASGGGVQETEGRRQGKWRSKEKPGNEAITMCNTKLRGEVASRGDQCVAESRVPPLPNATDTFLSQAVEALSLSCENGQGRTSRRRSVKTRQQTERNNTVGSSGLPGGFQGSKVASSPKQCGACGLEFTSIQGLSQHLLRHVYDGLYAAQWLTQAMTLVPSHQTPTGSGDSTQPIQTNQPQT